MLAMTGKLLRAMGKMLGMSGAVNSNFFRSTWEEDGYLAGGGLGGV